MNDNDVTERGIECAIQNILHCHTTYQRCRREYKEIKELKYPTHEPLRINEILEFRKQWLLDSIIVAKSKAIMDNVYDNLVLAIRKFCDIGLPEEIDILYNGYYVSFCSHADNSKTFWVGHNNIVHAYDVPVVSNE